MKITKLSILALLMLLISGGLVVAQDLAGSLNGTIGPGSFNVIDSIYVESGQTLYIFPGTTFNFAGAFGFGVAGEIFAMGEEADSIKFIPAFGVPFWRGIEFTSLAPSTCVMQYCLISGSADMGIYLSTTGNVTIDHCNFTMNSAAEMGGGIYCYSTDATITNCEFSYNTAVNGGGIVIRFCAPVFKNNVLYGNNGTYGGAMAIYFGTPFLVENCLFYMNSGNQGGGIRSSSGTEEIVNCTFVNNSAAQGAGLFIINQTPVIRNCNFWGNVGDMQINLYAGGIDISYTNVQGGYAGTGNLNADPEFCTGTCGDYCLSHIAAGQATNSPLIDAGDPVSTLITGTTRTDEVLDEGIVDIGFHYLYEDTPIMMDVTLTPVGLPILIPANGGSFEFNIMVENNGPGTVNCDVWTMVTLPNGLEYGPFINVNLNSAPGFAGDRDRMQNVPASAPAVLYTYHGYVGVYPSEIYAEDQFEFQKLIFDNGGPFVYDWASWGESFDNPDAVTINTVSDYSLNSAYPNPFNPETTISYSLPEVSHVSIKIYSVQGREVAELIDGIQSAGVNELVFDASNLTSGVYFAKMVAGDYQATQKLLLVK